MKRWNCEKIETKKNSWSQHIQKSKKVKVLWRRKKKRKKKNHVAWLVATCFIYLRKTKINHDELSTCHVKVKQRNQKEKFVVVDKRVRGGLEESFGMLMILTIRVCVLRIIFPKLYALWNSKIKLLINVIYLF